MSTIGIGLCFLLFLCFLLYLPLAIVMILGALKMRKLESHGLAVLASILAMLPCHPAFLIGLPIGIWALIVLSKPEVKAAFAARSCRGGPAAGTPVPRNEPTSGAKPASVLPAAALDASGPSGQAQSPQDDVPRRRRWPERVFVGLIVSVVAALAAYNLGPRLLHGPVGAKLLYEVDREKYPKAVDMEAIVKAVDGRLNPDRFHQQAEVKALPGGQISIGVFGNDPQRVAQVEKLVSPPGTLEFCILANRQEHGDLINQAVQGGGGELRDASGRTGRWVPVRNDELTIASLEIDPQRAIRNVDDGHKEVLVLNYRDGFNVTERNVMEVHIESANRGGQHPIRCEFDARARFLFRTLEDRRSEFFPRLGIILDGQLVSAPAIHTTIDGQRVTGGLNGNEEAESRAIDEVTGEFSEAEAGEIRAILDTRVLPAPLRKVNRTDARLPGVPQAIDSLKSQPLPSSILK